MEPVEACNTCPAQVRAVLCEAGGTGVPAFAQVRHQHRYLARQTLYHEETPALGLYVCCHGRIKVSRAGGNGREQILRLVDPGGVLGEEVLIEGARYVGTARALEDSLAAFVAREDLLRLLRTHDGLGVSLLFHLARELVSIQTHLTRVALADARSRLATLLLDLCGRYGQPARGGDPAHMTMGQANGLGVQLALNLSRSELAAMVGLTPETVIWLLSEFREEGILRTEGRAVTLLAPERLKALTLERPEAPLARGH